MARSWARRALTAAVALITVAAASGLASPRTAAAFPRVPFYLALGDSLAFGFQPNDDLAHGYVPGVYAGLRTEIPALQLENLGCPGETTAELLAGPPHEAQCAALYWQLNRTRDQLDAAVRFLHTHNVDAITVDIGGNDVAHCVSDAGVIDTTCLGSVMTQAPANLSRIISALHKAAPHTPIVGMSYYDPFLALWETGVPSLRATALGSVAILVAYNNALSTAYTEAGALVADVQDAFHTTDTTPIGDPAGTPTDVAWLCTLAWSCETLTFTPPYVDIHPNTTGYALIAATYLATFPSLED